MDKTYSRSQVQVLDQMAEDLTVNQLLQLEDEAYVSTMTNILENGTLQSEDL